MVRRVFAVFLMLAVMGVTARTAGGTAAQDEGEQLAAQLFLSSGLHKARIPPLKAGRLRLSGPLNSSGLYSCDGSGSEESLRGCSWCNSRFGVMGADKRSGTYPFGKKKKGVIRGSAWFYADIDATSGEVLCLVAYGNGDCRFPTAFYTPGALEGSYGHVGTEGFVFNGVGKMVQQGNAGLEASPAQIRILGLDNLLVAAHGAKIPVNYILGGRGIAPETRDAGGINADSGSGTATVERHADDPVRKKQELEDFQTGNYIVPGMRGGATLKKLNDTTYSFAVELGDGLHATSWGSDKCRKKGATLVCPEQGLDRDSDTMISSQVTIRQQSPNELVLEAGPGVAAYWCGASICFDGFMYIKK